jgi:transglutaminase-like putative cysteine protease
MRIRLGYRLNFSFPAPTPMIVMLNVHYTRVGDLERPDHIVTSVPAPIQGYRDSFGNWCSRIVAPAGRMRLAADGVVRDSGLPDPVFSSAVQHAVEDLPADTLV